jgi:RNA-directed DNA polymerase
MTAAATLAGAAPDVVPGWHSIDWKKVWHHVRRLQARIVKATQEGRWNKVRALVYLLTHSYSGRAAAILRVTTNAGATTPGVDGETWNTPELKAAAFSRLRRRGYQPQPLRRVYIPKSSDPSQRRPLGIPTMTDRAMQALYLLGLDPIMETTADANSYGFRSQRSCADALEQCHNLLCNKHNATWILEGDIKACFDRISHDWLLTHIPTDKVILRHWLQAGYLEKDAFHATTAGTPQGGVISPALANRTLDGLERLLQERFGATQRQQKQLKVHLVRYADDFIITGTSNELLRDEVQPLVAHFLKERGLELSHEKTSITHVNDGFDFLGQHVQRFGTKTLLRPSGKNVKAFLAKIDEVIQHRSGYLTAGDLIWQLNAKIRGWALYHRHAASKRTFAHVDHVIFHKLWHWARRRHRGKSAAWVKAKYFTRPGDERWRFHGTIRDNEGGYQPIRLVHACDIPIRRHVKIKGAANPYDPTWELYFEERLARQMTSTLLGQSRARYLWLEQDGKCLVCRQPLTLAAGWHVHHVRWRVHGGDDDLDNLVLLHPNCHRQVHSEGLVVEKVASREGRSSKA